MTSLRNCLLLLSALGIFAAVHGETHRKPVPVFVSQAEHPSLSVDAVAHHAPVSSMPSRSADVDTDEIVAKSAVWTTYVPYGGDSPLGIPENYWLVRTGRSPPASSKLHRF